MRLNGAIPKWSKGMVCKTIIRGFESRSHLRFHRFQRRKTKRPRLVEPGSLSFLRAVSQGAAVKVPRDSVPFTFRAEPPSRSAAAAPLSAPSQVNASMGFLMIPEWSAPLL